MIIYRELVAYALEYPRAGPQRNKNLKLRVVSPIRLDGKWSWTGSRWPLLCRAEVMTTWFFYLRFITKSCVSPRTNAIQDIVNSAVCTFCHTYPWLVLILERHLNIGWDGVFLVKRTDSTKCFNWRLSRATGKTPHINWHFILCWLSQRPNLSDLDPW